MSTTLSIISRQFAPSTRSESQVQPDHSSENAPSIRGMTTCSGGGLPSGSFHTNNCLFCSRVSQDLVRAPAVPAPAPVVERAGDLVALDRALGQVAAHVTAVPVEHVQLAA